MAFPLLKLLVLRTHRLEELKDFYGALGIKFVEEQHGKVRSTTPDRSAPPFWSCIR